jgi:hypothetical protein
VKYLLTSSIVRLTTVHFSRAILRFEELLRNEQIKEAIKERPEKYRLLIKTKAEIKNT